MEFTRLSVEPLIELCLSFIGKISELKAKSHIQGQSNAIDSVEFLISQLKAHPQFVCHSLNKLHRLKGCSSGIEEALGTHQQRAVG